MTETENQEMALFRFSLIAPVVNQTFEAPSMSQFFKNVASKSYTLPNGVIANYSAATISSWYDLYRKYGFDGLIPKSRKDLGVPRALDQRAIQQIHSLKEQFPYITGKLVYKKLIEEGYISQKNTSLATVLRYIRDNNLKPNQLCPIEKKAFEMEFANDCWQADTSHGPVIKIDGQKYQTYMIAFIDDASRMLLHVEFFLNDNSFNMQAVFRKAVSKYGIPKRVYVDNGKTYKNNQFFQICASLGVMLVHTQPYEPSSKGKIERVFRTIKDNWMNGTDWNQFNSLDDLNEAINVFLSDNYLNSIHSSINDTPRNRFLRDSSRLKYISAEEIENHFLHRIIRKVANDSTIKLYTLTFEVPSIYIGQNIKIRYWPEDMTKAYIFSDDNKLLKTIYQVKKVDNSRIKRSSIDYSKFKEEKTYV